MEYPAASWRREHLRGWNAASQYPKLFVEQRYQLLMEEDFALCQVALLGCEATTESFGLKAVDADRPLSFLHVVENCSTYWKVILPWLHWYSHFWIHSRPTRYLHGSITAHSMIPLPAAIVAYSFKQIMQLAPDSRPFASCLGS